ncbi:hypothetical protein [Streptomyces sp. NPDC048845]|uniref:hypothetical protein n=1 Tax=Streptomyces sp. NPDC048845 TaxID=3155390 RepID=UPI003415A94B
MLNWLYNTFWANWTKKALTTLVTAAVVTAAAVLADRLIGAPDLCANGVERSDGECIGVNGSGYDFGTDEITEVSRAIAGENARISGKPHVTVAVMVPLQPKGEAGKRQLRSDLQGAYLAQYRANRQEKSPLLRLVLANPGADYRQQERVVDRLAAMAESGKDNLRAVTGFNLSLASTEEAIRRLTNDLGIPVLASRVSADELANPESRTGKPRFNGLPYRNRSCTGHLRPRDRTIAR